MPLHRGADRLSLLKPVTALLRERGIAFAVIGAAAMAVHGVSRSTRDVDLFTLAQECLEAAFWKALRLTSVEARARKGDVDDPLAGVVRITAGCSCPWPAGSS